MPTIDLVLFGHEKVVYSCLPNFVFHIKKLPSFNQLRYFIGISIAHIEDMLKSLLPMPAVIWILFLGWGSRGQAEILARAENDRVVIRQANESASPQCSLQGEGESLVATGLNCSGLVASAGIAALKSGLPDSSWLKVAPVVARIAPKILIPVAVISIPVSLYSVASFGADAFRKDQECYYDVEYKRGLLQIAQRNAELIRDAYQTSPRENGNRILSMDQPQEGDVADFSIPPIYLTTEFLESLSCTRLYKILNAKKKKQDAWVGRLISNRSNLSDPRLKINGAALPLLKELSDRFQCSSNVKRAEIICAAGNLALFGRNMVPTAAKPSRMNLEGRDAQMPLISKNSSVVDQPNYHRFGTGEKHIVDELNDLYRSSSVAHWEKSLTSFERRALQDIGTIDYKGYSNYLRSSGEWRRELEGSLRNYGELDQAVKDRIKAIDSAIAKGVLDRNTVLYRGISENGFPYRWDQLKPGSQLSDQNYLFATANKKVADNWLSEVRVAKRGDFSKTIVLEIETPKGTRVAYIDPVSRNMRSGTYGEIILGRNSVLRVKSKYTDSQGLRHLVLTVSGGT